MPKYPTITVRVPVGLKEIFAKIAKEIAPKDKVIYPNYGAFTKKAINHFCNSDELGEYLRGIGLDDEKVTIYTEELRNTI